MAATCELEATPSLDMGNWNMKGFTKVCTHTVAQDLILGISCCEGEFKASETVSATFLGANIKGNLVTTSGIHRMPGVHTFNNIEAGRGRLPGKARCIYLLIIAVL
ncbi:hypothetical protein [Serratia fonticola]|uniref:hypothetical protein n=1 Tax=Serratia fonticola TaxID=47917 RepID=UPI001268DD3E|nr:hypothetical protein [Serratia fonticola]